MPLGQAVNQPSYEQFFEAHDAIGLPPLPAEPMALPCQLSTLLLSDS